MLEGSIIMENVGQIFSEFFRKKILQLRSSKTKITKKMAKTGLFWHFWGQNEVQKWPKISILTRNFNFFQKTKFTNVLSGPKLP